MSTDCRPDIRICFFGDSFVNGTNDPSYLGWTGRICAAMASPRFELTHYNLGIRGNSSEQIEARWQAESALRFTSECDARLVFSFGTNDNRIEANQLLVQPRNSIACAQRILTQAKALHPTLLVGPPPVSDSAMNQRNAESSEAYARLCEQIGVPYLAVHQPLLNESWMREITADGYHPAAAGYAALADLVLQWPAWQAWFA